MAKTSSMYIRIDPEIKTEVEKIYKRYGMSLTDAINIFIYQSRNVGGLPFDLRPETRVDRLMPEIKSSAMGLRGKYKDILSTDMFMIQKQREKELEE
ncbi:MAG: type II toxin-antitoxin system RelB/DinJ family antitoxin [Peptococcaceae bacterium]|nr:type II toxin-antitoxin system RelB/DinJ family antitoxin [Peptococcaceae bacterium]